MATPLIEFQSQEIALQSLAALEFVIERGLQTFVEVGKALAEICEGKLYRWQGYSTFEEYCQKRWGMARRTAYSYVSSANVAENVHTCAQSPLSLGQARELAALPAEQQREVVQAIQESGLSLEDVTVRQVADVVHDVKAGASPKLAVHFSSDSPEWYTPPEIIARTMILFDEIDLDPCSNIGEPNVPAARHFTEAENGLVQPWEGRVYMNPPYGRPIVDWVEKLVAEHASGRVTEAIALVPARVDTDWFRKFRDCAVCFIDGRLKFSGHDNSAPFPSAVVYLGGRIDDFHGAFSEAGDIWVRWSK